MTHSLTNRAFFSTDRNLETVSGIPVCIGDWKFQTRRAGGSNHAFQARVTGLRKPHERVLNEKPGANDDALVIRQNELLRPILVEAASEKLLLAWEGVINADLYEEVPEGVDPDAAALFTKQNAIALFTRFPDAFDEFFAEASKMGNFRKMVVEDQSGNSVTA